MNGHTNARDSKGNYRRTYETSKPAAQDVIPHLPPPKAPPASSKS